MYSLHRGKLILDIPPHAHAVIFHPQTWCMVDLVIVGIVMGDQRRPRVAT